MKKQESMENNWIDINLPWDRTIVYPDITDAIIEKFGYTEDDLTDEFKRKTGQEYWYVDSVVGDKWLCEITGKHWWDFEEINEAFEELESSKNELLLDLIETKKKLEQIQDFSAEFGETEEYKAAYEKSLEQASLCFRNHELRRPGVLIEVKDEVSAPKQYLIGDVNKNGGVCDDCMAFSHCAIVLRAKVLIDKDWL